jgi:hypothetical protein
MGFDFDAAVSVPHRMQPGLRRLAPGATQLTPSVAPQRGLARHLREKLAVLGAFAGQALLCMPGFDPRRALDALAALAAAEHPAALQIVDRHWQAPWLGWSVDAQAQPQDLGGGWPEIGPLLAQLPADWRHAALLSLAFAEDFAILDRSSGTLPWLAVALPSMWAPEHKVGLGFAELHAPVADNRLILAAAPQLIRLVTTDRPCNAPGAHAVAQPDRIDRIDSADGADHADSADSADRWERFVWTLSAHPRLHAHPQRVDTARWPAGLDDDALAAQTWWRTERQTFIPVPPADVATPGSAAGAQAVFTILVNVTPLARAFSHPAQAGRVHDALASMSDAVLAYRGLTDVRTPLLRWLARQAQALPTRHGMAAGVEP